MDQDPIYDLAIIGGGVNGCGIARDAAGRGASVILFEQGDLASGTSSGSTKLIHGGLRYLEHYDFRLVREALREREVLWRLAPHIVRPLRFVLPQNAGMRPAWLVRLGLFLYDRLGGRELLSGTRSLALDDDPAGSPLKPVFTRAFEYCDCWVDDARLVVLNARDAAEREARIRTRTRVVAAERSGKLWRVTVESAGARRDKIMARTLVNAAGPWAGGVLKDIIGATPIALRLVQGSHIVVPRLFDHDRAYTFQNRDGRILFAIPYEHDFTLVGTTDRDYRGDPARAAASEEEISYLCAAASAYFRQPVRNEDVVWTYCGVRALLDDGGSKAQEVTRDYVLMLDAPADSPALLSVLGGKITTYRRLAEAALERLAAHLPAARRPKWTGRTPLPGGDFPHDGYEALVAATLGRHPYLGAALAARLVCAFGTRVARLLDGARSASDLGRDFGAGLSEREVCYLVDQEWAVDADDILWRRSKLGLRVTAAEVASLEEFLRRRAGAGHSPADQKTAV